MKKALLALFYFLVAFLAASYLPLFTKTFLVASIESYFGFFGHFIIYLLYAVCYLAVGDYIGRKFKEKKIIFLILALGWILLYHLFPYLIAVIAAGGGLGFVASAFKSYPYLLFTPLIIPGALFSEKLQTPGIIKSLRYVAIGLWILTFISLIVLNVFVFIRGGSIISTICIISIIITIITGWRLWSLKVKETSLMEISVVFEIIVFLLIMCLIDCPR